MKGKVVALCISPEAGAPMQSLPEVKAIAGIGLAGDRYAKGEGSFNQGIQGRRQVTLINALFFRGSNFKFVESRRNIVVEGVELNWLVGKVFSVGQAKLRGIKYCDPCNRPSKLAGKPESFQEEFFDRGGLIAEVLETGVICVGDDVIPPAKGY